MEGGGDYDFTFGGDFGDMRGERKGGREGGREGREGAMLCCDPT